MLPICMLCVTAGGLSPCHHVDSRHAAKRPEGLKGSDNSPYRRVWYSRSKCHSCERIVHELFPCVYLIGLLSDHPCMVLSQHAPVADTMYYCLDS